MRKRETDKQTTTETDRQGERVSVMRRRMHVNKEEEDACHMSH
jgi:hypothetical protein